MERDLRGRDLRWITFEAIPSTQAWARAMWSRYSLKPGQWVWACARRQTQGEGQFGRRWVSPYGNIYATLSLLWPSSQANLVTLWPRMAAGCVRDTILEMNTEDHPTWDIFLKKPNDVMVACGESSYKVAGVLVENLGRAERIHEGGPWITVLVGIGVNLNTVPEGVEQAVMALSTLTKRACSTSIFLRSLDAKLHERVLSSVPS